VSLAITVNGSTVSLAGAVDEQTSPSLRAELVALITTAGPGTELTVDLTEVSFVDSSGLAVLIGAHKLAVSGEVRLVLTGLPRHVARTLQITGLDKVLDIAERP
jgi:anti-sigma B factor antagonist